MLFVPQQLKLPEPSPREQKLSFSTENGEGNRGCTWKAQCGPTLCNVIWTLTCAAICRRCISKNAPDAGAAGPEEVLVVVRAAALNFKDVVIGLDLITVRPPAVNNRTVFIMQSRTVCWSLTSH